MKKRWMILMMAVLLAVLPLTAYASETSGEDGWQVVFNGKKLEGNFDDKDTADVLGNLEPGDQVAMEVSVKNAHKRATDWYLSNEILKSFEEPESGAAARAAQPAGGAYTYILTYEDASGQITDLYNSNMIGGDKDESTGLREIEDSLKEYFYLGRLESGQGGKLRLSIMLDGETQWNDYARTLASLKLKFAVEDVPEATVTPGGGGSNTTIFRTVPTYITGGVQTGDNSRVLFWTVISLASGLALLLLCVLRLRQNRGGNGNEE